MNQVDQSKVSLSILSDITTHMKYAKYNEQIQRRETFDEISDRNMLSHIKKYPQLKDEIEIAYNNFVKPKKTLPSMRSMQFAGTPIDRSPVRIYNCSFLPVDNLLAFSETIFLLLSGVGVGYSVQTHHIEKLPEVHKPLQNKSKRFLIGDSIEGWSDSVKVLIKSYFYSGPTIKFDYSDIRPKGARLITAGGKAPGPDPLKECHLKVTHILNQKEDGDQLTSLEVHDIMCHLADAVLAGGIRRAAMISLFDADDMNMISCKSGDWWELNPQRGRANNSAVLLRNKITESYFKELWKRIELSRAGEPGIFFTNDKDWGTNPCCLTGDTKINIVDPECSNKLKTIDFYSLLKMKEDKISLPLVASINLDSNDKSIEYKQISDVFLTKQNAEVIELVYNSGDAKETVKCTPDHRIYTENGYIEAQNLKLGDKIVSNAYNTPYVILTEINKVEVLYDVYDIEVEDNHNFFANSILVHNCEVSLRSFQFCNLCEVNISDITSQEDLNERVKVAAFIGTLQAGYTDFHYLRPIWKKTTEKEALIGVGLTGIGSGEYKKYNLIEVANIVKEENERVAKLIGINKAARTTVVKPSGTASLIAGTSSGVHAWHNDYYIRRIRVNKNEAIYTYLLINHPELVKDEYFSPHKTAVIEIPVKAPDNAIYRTESPIETLDRVKHFHIDWIKPGHRKGQNTNNVSATISIKDNEWNEVGNWMWENRNSYTGISVLPYDGGSYIQAPFEDITKEQYDELVKHLIKVDLSKVIELSDETDLANELACAGSSCEIV